MLYDKWYREGFAKLEQSVCGEGRALRFYPQYCLTCGCSFVSEKRNADCWSCNSGDTVNCYRERNKKMKKYQIIYADPPWRQSKGGKKNVRPNSSGKQLDYPVLSLDDIQTILKSAGEISRDNRVMFLWTIEKYLPQAEQIASNLDYKLHARMIWNKVTGIPAAFTIRYGHDCLLYLYHGKLLPVAKEERGKIHSVFTEQVTRHSKKPQIAYEIIERLYPNVQRLELFARERRQGWDVWGNEVDSDIDLGVAQ